VDDVDKGKHEELGEKPVPVPNLSTINPTWTDQGVNLRQQLKA
jgi:hypothetical protein